MDKVANKTNKGQPDPITNRSMSDACWNSLHFGSKYTTRCTGWFEQCRKCETKHADKPNGCPCACHTRRCDCVCHDSQEHKPKVKRDKNATMNILDSGCGTIEIK